MDKRMTEAYKDSLLNTKIPRLNVLNYKDANEYYHRKVCFNTLVACGFEIEEASEASRRYTGTAQERLNSILEVAA